jgi:hypothetical protein
LQETVVSNDYESQKSSALNKYLFLTFKTGESIYEFWGTFFQNLPTEAL